jgi:hypothetical protein
MKILSCTTAYQPQFGVSAIFLPLLGRVSQCMYDASYMHLKTMYLRLNGYGLLRLSNTSVYAVQPLETLPKLLCVLSKTKTVLFAVHHR